MEENKITWSNKVTLVARPDLPPQNKVTAPDMNQIKAGLNATIDELILVEGRVTDLETDLTTAEGAISTLQTDLTTAEGAISTLETDVSTLQTDLTTAQGDILGKEDVTNKAVNFTDPDDEKYPTTLAVVDYIPTLFPENDEITIDLLGGEAAVVSNFTPTSGTVLTFDAPRSYGSWKSPKTALTISFTDAKPVQKSIYFIEATSLPSAIDPSQDYMLPISGDAFDTTVGVVNRLEITQTTEPSPQNNFIHIHNTAVDISAIGVDTSLIAFYKFEELSGNYDNIIDETGYGHDGTINTSGGSTRVTGTIGNAAQFSVTNRRFSVPHTSAMNLTNQFTFACYVSMSSSNFGSRLGIASKDADSDGAGALGGWIISRETAGQFRVRINGSTSYQAESAYLYSTTDVVVHLAVTYNAGVIKIYINKVLNATDTNADANIINGNQPLFIGGAESASVGSIYLRGGGTIDEARYYNRELDATEITALP